MRVPEHITWKNLATGVVLLNLTDSTYYVLNETASVLWRAILEGKDEGGLASCLTAAFDCSTEQAIADSKETLEYFRKEGFLGPA